MPFIFSPVTTASNYFTNAFELTHDRLPTQEEIDKHDDLCARSFPLKRLASVEDSAHMLVFLASKKADFVTGVCVPVDGGYACSSYTPPPK